MGRVYHYWQVIKVKSKDGKIKYLEVSQLIEEIINEAIEVEASDIHIEPESETTRIRFRIDGDLIKICDIPSERQSEIITRIKILSNLDIAERRLPQDGRISWNDSKDTDLRVAITPVIHGEKAVIRILNSTRYDMRLDKFGFSEENYNTLKGILSKSSGMLISTGPTGCGKSTTLYALIRELNNVDANIITIEDPVEFKIKGINQTQVNEKAGMDFSIGLRSMLRSDPDIIMVGEIRDKKTAEIAIRAAITGHLLLSSLHTMDSYSAIIRLLDMGIEPYLIASALAGVQSQRLVKRLCPHCSAKMEPNISQLNIIKSVIGDIGDVNLKAPLGCEHCTNGFRGRQVISEVFEIDEDFINAIKNKSDINTLRKIGEEKGIKSLVYDGLSRVIKGELYIDDVLRHAYNLGECNGQIQSIKKDS